MVQTWQELTNFCPWYIIVTLSFSFCICHLISIPFIRIHWCIEALPICPLSSYIVSQIAAAGDTMGISLVQNLFISPLMIYIRLIGKPNPRPLCNERHAVCASKLANSDYLICGANYTTLFSAHFFAPRSTNSFESLLVLIW